MDREQWARHLLDCLNGWLDNRHSDNPEVRSEYQEDLISALTTTPSTPAPATEGEAVKLLRDLAREAKNLRVHGPGAIPAAIAVVAADEFLARLDSKGPTP